MQTFVLKSHDVLTRCIAALGRATGMEVCIRKPVRSQASNRYYWNILGIISKDTGNDPEDLHDLLKIRVLGLQYITVSGETIAIPKRSRDVTQAEFNKLTQAADMMAVSLNIKIPAPEYYGLE